MNVLCVVSQNTRHETAMFLGLKARGINLRVATAKPREPDYSQLIDAGIPVETVPVKNRIDRDAVKILRTMIRERNIDIVHAFNNRTVSNALRASKNLPVRFVAYRGIVGNVSFINPASWMTYLNPRVDRIVCVAEAIREYLLNLRFAGLKIPGYKPVTIYKGHDMRWYSGKPADLSEFGIRPGDFVVACTANFRPRKGVDVLIRALGLLPTDIHLLLIGHMDHPRLIRLIERSDHRERIHLAGYRENAPEMQAACNVCVLPSIRREGLPKTVMEGMAYGVPPIVTDSGGSPELIEQGVSGLVVESGSAQALAGAIRELYSDDARRRSMGAAARERIAREFTVERTVEQTDRLYRELVEPPRG